MGVSVGVLIKEQFVEVGESQWHLKKHRCQSKTRNRTLVSAQKEGLLETTGILNWLGAPFGVSL